MNEEQLKELLASVVGGAVKEIKDEIATVKGEVAEIKASAEAAKKEQEDLKAKAEVEAVAKAKEAEDLKAKAEIANKEPERHSEQTIVTKFGEEVKASEHKDLLASINDRKLDYVSSMAAKLAAIYN